jgi:hypothetical protein
VIFSVWLGCLRLDGRFWRSGRGELGRGVCRLVVWIGFCVFFAVGEFDVVFGVRGVVVN